MIPEVPKLRRDVAHPSHRVVTYASATKYLGVILDAELKWKSHIHYIENKVTN